PENRRVPVARVMLAETAWPSRDAAVGGVTFAGCATRREGDSMKKLVGILGSVTAPGRMLTAMQHALRAAGGGIASVLIYLAECRVAFADGRPPEEYGDDTA